MRFILSAMGAIILKQMSDKDSFMFYEYEDLGGQYKRLKEQKRTLKAGRATQKQFQ